MAMMATTAANHRRRAELDGQLAVRVRVRECRSIGLASEHFGVRQLSWRPVSLIEREK